MSTSTQIEIQSKELENCPICLQVNFQMVLDLPNYPVTEFFADEKTRASSVEIGYNQKLNICLSCFHVYLENQLLPEFIYNGDYQTIASVSAPAQLATLRFMNCINEFFEISKFELVMDIGANDGSFLRQLNQLSFKGKKYAIDPSFTSWDADVEGFTMFVEDFDFQNLSHYSRRLFVASHVMEHVASPSVVIEKLSQCINEDDLIVLQFPAIEPLIHESRFDQIHHQHFHYFSYDSFCRMIESSNLQIVSSFIDWQHYGAAVVFLSKAGNRQILEVGQNEWENLRDLVPVSQDSIVSSYSTFTSYLDFIKRQLSDCAWISIGAGLMSPIIFYYLQGAWENCIGIYDENATKQGKRYANTPCAIDPFPEHSKAKTGLLTGSVSRLAGRELFTKASSMNLDKILIPVTTI